MLGQGLASAQNLNQQLDYIGPITLSNNDLGNGIGIDTVAFRGVFENVTWQGNLFAYSVADDGRITQDPLWSALDKFTELEADNNYWKRRKIYLRSSSGNRQEFEWSKLTQQNQEYLRSRDIVNFIRGDRSNEGLTIRRRESILGAIIRSNPVYVGKPKADINTLSYKIFATENASRTAIVYVGANDGMLHAFNAATGKETWAYIPSMLVSSLADLADEPYSLRHYVDGDLNVQDVKLPDDRWRTVLVGGLGAGGKGLFAVDVTSPAAPEFLWEKQADGDDDMGHIYRSSSLVKLPDDQWYAVNGNGFNSVNGNALLYLIDVGSGDVKKATVGSNAMGLSAPTLIDTDSNGTADFAYAGDLQGDVWSFNLADLDNIITRRVYKGNIDQPISLAPVIARHALGGYWVVFGTGRSYTVGDNDNKVQALHGVWDKGSEAAIESDDLLSRTLSMNIDYTYRIDEDDPETAVTEVVRTYSNASTPVGNKAGWRIDLPAGERLLTPLLLRDGRLRVTATKSNTDARLNENWIMEASYDQGSADVGGHYDLNKDGDVDSGDRVDQNSDDILTDLHDTPTAWKQNKGLLSQATIARISSQQNDILFYNSMTPQQVPVIEAPPEPPSGCTGVCENGLKGGHLDVDTDTSLGGDTDEHSHEYDVRAGLTYVDYFDIEAGLDNLSTSKSFIIVIANADLSPGAKIIMGKDSLGNEISYNVVYYQKMIHEVLSNWNGIDELVDPDSGNSLIHTVASLKQNNGTLRIQLNSLAIVNGGLIATNTDCVKHNDIYNDRWRNGALTMHSIDRAHFDNSDSLSRVKVQTPSDLIENLFIEGKALNLEGFGGLHAKNTLSNNSGFIFESTIFWHYEGGPCYGESGYEKAVLKLRSKLLLKYGNLDSADTEKAKKCEKASSAVIAECQAWLNNFNPYINSRDEGSGNNPSDGTGPNDGSDSDDGDGSGDNSSDDSDSSDNSTLTIQSNPRDGIISPRADFDVGRASWIDVMD
jgi:hypothetical protein